MADYNLTADEKISVIVTHLRNLSYTKYNLEMSLLEENALATPSVEVINQLNSQIESANAKAAALVAEMQSLQQ
jgi:hypothetical protein